MSEPRSWLKLEDGTVWPDPCDPTEAAWKLRYVDDPSPQTRAVAASVLAAYKALMFMPNRERDKKIAMIRRAVREVPSEQSQ